MGGVMESIAVNIAASIIFELGRAGLQNLRDKYGLSESLYERQLEAALSGSASHLANRIGYKTVEAFFSSELVKNYLVEHFRGSAPGSETLEVALRVHLGNDWLVFRELSTAGLTVSQVVIEFLEYAEQAALQQGGLAHVILGRKLDQIRDTKTGEYLDVVRRLTLLIEATLPERWGQLREGKRSATIAWVRELRATSTIWNNALPSDLKAKLLRLEAFAELQKPDGLNRAKQIAAEADTLLQSAEGERLRARICLVEKGPVQALEALAHTDDVECLNLKAALHLEQGQLPEARQILDDICRRLAPTSETYRVKALYHVLVKNLPQALADVDEALNRAPNWFGVKQTWGVVGCLSAISVAALSERIPVVPKPLSPGLIRTSPSDLERLRSAGEVLKSLAEDPEVTKEERRRLEAWALACLANDPRFQNEALAYCRSVLQDDKANPYVVTWVNSRGWPLDLAPTVETLTDELAAGRATTPQAAALFGCLLLREDKDGLLAALHKSERLFESEGEKVIWDFWRLQASLLTGDVPEAERCLVLLKDTEVEFIAREVFLRDQCERSGEGRPLADYFQQQFERTNDPVTLFQFCEVMAQLEKWSVVADHASQLVELIGTAGSVNLAATAAFNDGRYSLCLKLLEDHQAWFVGSRLPVRLRRLQVECKKNLGIIPQAVADAQDLARDYPTVANLLALTEVYYSHGDFLGVIFVARQLVLNPDVAPEHCLRLAKLVQWNDRQLSVKLWRKALQTNALPDNMVGPLVLVGFELGLEKELAPILRRLADLSVAQAYGFWQASVEEAADVIRGQRENATQIIGAYEQGRIPVHLAVQPLNLSLASLYHRLLNANHDSSGYFPTGYLYARNGGRALLSSPRETQQKWRLNIDVTAILLAAHLGILELVTSAFRPVRVPSHLVAALVSMRDRLAPTQPSRIKVYRTILKLVEQQRLKVIRQTSKRELTTAADQQAPDLCTVDFSPAEADGNTISCRDLVESLRQYGPLSEEEYLHALQTVRSDAPSSGDRTPPQQGVSVLLKFNIPEVLADAGVLSMVCDRFLAYVEEIEVQRATEEIKEHEAQEKLAEWVGQVLEAVRSGIAEGAFKVLPLVNRGESQQVDDEDVRSPELHCLLDLLSFEPTKDDVIWVDDRHVSGYLFRDGVPIIGVMDILSALVETGTLQKSDFYRIVNELRAGGTLFIPLSAEEIIHHLTFARVDSERVVDTYQLEVLRSYVSSCLARGPVLQRPHGAAQPGEIPFLLSVGREVVEALTHVWAMDDVPEEVRRARADWILENLYIDQYAIASIAELEPPGERLYVSGLGLASLCAAGLSLGSVRRPNSRVRKDFFSWLYDRVLRHRFDADPHLITVVGDLLKQILTAGDEEQPYSVSSDEMKVARILVTQGFYEDLPEPIQDELARDQEFMANLGFEEVRVVHLADHDIDNARFVLALREAVNGRPATALTSDETLVRFAPHPSAKSACRITLDNESVTLTDEILEILSDEPACREALLLRHRNWFDCSTERYARLVPELVTMPDPVKRMTDLEHWRRGSVASYYESLRSAIRQRSGLSSDTMQLPSAEKLSWFLRLSPSGTPGRDFPEDLCEAATTLLAEEDIASVIHKLSGVPVPLPKPLMTQILIIGEAERRKIIKSLMSRGQSPISRLHLVYLLCEMPEPQFRRLARWIIWQLVGESGKASFDAFLAVLKWVGSQSEQWALSPTSRLAAVWSHAHLVFSSLVSEGVTLEWVRYAFERWGRLITSDTFRRPPDYWYDLCHPRNVSRVSSLLTGLAYSIAEHDDILTPSLRTHLTALASLPMGDISFPAVELLRDPAQYPDILASFMGGNRGARLKVILGEDTAALLSSEAINLIVSAAVGELEAHQASTVAWAIVHRIYGGGRPSSDIAARISTLIRGTDFVALHQHDEECARIALITAASHIGLTGDETLRQHLIGQMLLLARGLNDPLSKTAKGPNVQRAVFTGFSLMEAALDVTAVQGDLESTVTAWADILKGILENAPALGPHYRWALALIVRVLPTGVCHHAWKLLNLARRGTSPSAVD